MSNMFKDSLAQGTCDTAECVEERSQTGPISGENDEPGPVNIT